MASFLFNNERSEQSEVNTGEQRPGMLEIQDIFKRMSLSPFHNQHTGNGFLSDRLDNTDSSGSHTTQNGCQNRVNPFDHSVQNGLTSKPSNPFLTTNQLSGLGSTTVNPFLNQGKDTENNNNVLPSSKEFVASCTQDDSWAHFPPVSAASLGDDWAIFPPQTRPSSQSTSLSRTFSDDLARFQLSSAKEGTGISQKLECSQSDRRDELLESILSKQNNEALHSFSPPPVVNGGVFIPTTPRSSDILSTSVQNRVLQSPSPVQTPVSTQYEMKPVSYSSNYSPLNNDQLKPPEKNLNKLGTPRELTNGISHTFALSQSASTDGGVVPKRPPKPAPRTKVQKPSGQSDNNRTLSTPVISTPTYQTPIRTPPTSPFAAPISVSQVKTNIQEAMPAEQETNEFYEDILLIGKEQCVEDWPEDSPMLSPDWIPAGKLKLRRDSLRIAADIDSKTLSLGKKTKIKSKRPSLLYKKGSKEITPETMNGADPSAWETKGHDGTSEDVLSDKDELNAAANKTSVKKKRTKLIVPHLSYRGPRKNSLTLNSVPDSVHVLKDDMFDDPNEVKMRNGEKKDMTDMKDSKPKESLKYKLSVLRRHSKDIFEDDLKKIDGPFLEESKENSYVNTNTDGHKRRLSPELPLGSQDEFFSQKGPEPFTSLENTGKKQELQDCRPKKPVKFIVPHLSRKPRRAEDKDGTWKEDDLSKPSKVKGSDLNGNEDCTPLKKSPVLKAPLLSPRASKSMKDAVASEKAADLLKSESMDTENWPGKNRTEAKPKKFNKSPKLSKESKNPQDHAFFPEDIELPGATASNFYLSDAAKAEWMSSQMDVRRAITPEEDEEEEEGLEGVKEEEDGDTDSLMEWWNTVELWDELPSDEEISLKEDETKSFTEIAEKVHRGLRVFYQLFTEQAEILYEHVLLLYAIGDNVSNFHRRTKIANITGSTTTAVGGVTAIAGLALAPFTLGASLIVSAVGLGVATAGGITAASAAISDNVHDMSDRKKIEVVAQDFETRLTELRRCLSFVSEGVHRLRCHPLLRRNNYYAGNWEVRRALQTVTQVGEPVEHAEEIVKNALVAMNSMCSGMDKYFSKDSKEVKKGFKKEVTIQVHFLAKLLQDSLVELNSIREQLMEATGQV